MKKLLLLLLLPFACPAADMELIAEYGKAYTVNFCLPDDTDPTNLIATATFATGDVVVMKDEGSETNKDVAGVGTLPIDEGTCYSMVFTATEMEAKRVLAIIIDQTATRVWADFSIYIETCQGPNAQHMSCFGGPYVAGGTSTFASNTATTTELTGQTWADDEVRGMLLCIVEDINSGDPLECQPVTQWVNSTAIATHLAFSAALPQNGEWVLYPQPQTVLNVLDGVVESNVVQVESTDATDQLSTSIAAELTAIDLDHLADAVVTNVAGAATSAGNAAGSTIVDTSLTEADNYWNGQSVTLTSGSFSGQCREIVDFVNSSNTLYLIAFGGQVASGVTYVISTQKCGS